jgi:hypothetical protein
MWTENLCDSSLATQGVRAVRWWGFPAGSQKRAGGDGAQGRRVGALRQLTTDRYVHKTVAVTTFSVQPNLLEFLRREGF